jgi:hypothetical protein
VEKGKILSMPEPKLRPIGGAASRYNDCAAAAHLHFTAWNGELEMTLKELFLT